MDAYEKSKLQWMQDHDCTVTDLVRSVVEILANEVNSRNDLLLVNIDALVDELESGNNLNGMMYPCRAEWEDCEEREEAEAETRERKVQTTIQLPIAVCSPAGKEATLLLTAEENTSPEFGPEITIGLADENDNWLQTLVSVQERGFDQPDGSVEHKIEVLLYEDELDDGYTSSKQIKIHPELMSEVMLPATFFSEGQKRPEEKQSVPGRMITPEEALARSLADKGKVDLEYMDELINFLTQDEIVDALDGKIYLLPEPLDENGYGHFVTAGEYLSGSREELEKRLSDAIAASEMSACFDSNVIALQKLLCGKCLIPDLKASSHIETLGGWFDKYGIPHFDAEVFATLQYAGDSVNFPGKKALMLPSDNGQILIIEDRNFVIDNKKEEGKE